MKVEDVKSFDFDEAAKTHTDGFDDGYDDERTDAENGWEVAFMEGEEIALEEQSKDEGFWDEE
jgi:hypothetical protein